MKKVFLNILAISFIGLSILSCDKEDSIPKQNVAIPSVEHFTADLAGNSINLNWSYAYTGDISCYILYYSPGGEINDTINPYESYYQVLPIVKDTNYLFNIRAIDKKGNVSAAKIARVSTY